MNGRTSILAAATAVMAISVTALGDIVNGDFESGGTGWAVSVPPGWSATFPPTGGNPDGHAAIMSPLGDSEGEACILQVFDCGTESDTIEISMDFRCDAIDANCDAGRIRIFLDNKLILEHPCACFEDPPYETMTFLAPGGFHSISLCLQVDAGNNGYLAEFDNVTATVVIPTGACCVNGGCLELDAESCESVKGSYQGNDTDCADVSCPPQCPGDADGDGAITFTDLLIVLSGWGPCP